MTELSRPGRQKVDRPLVVWDGDCPFCLWSMVLLRHLVGDKIDDAPYQTAHREFPSLDYEDFAEQVYLLTPDGEAYGGAEAVYRALALDDRRVFRLGRWLYDHVGLFARFSEWFYDWVSRHRPQLTSALKPLLGPD